MRVYNEINGRLNQTYTEIRQLIHSIYLELLINTRTTATKLVLDEPPPLDGAPPSSTKDIKSCLYVVAQLGPVRYSSPAGPETFQATRSDRQRCPVASGFRPDFGRG